MMIAFWSGPFLPCFVSVSDITLHTLYDLARSRPRRFVLHVPYVHPCTRNLAAPLSQNRKFVAITRPA